MPHRYSRFASLDLHGRCACGTEGRTRQDVHSRRPRTRKRVVMLLRVRTIRTVASSTGRVGCPAGRQWYLENVASGFRRGDSRSVACKPRSLLNGGPQRTFCVRSVHPSERRRSLGCRLFPRGCALLEQPPWTTWAAFISFSARPQTFVQATDMPVRGGVDRLSLRRVVGRDLFVCHREQRQTTL